MNVISAIKMIGLSTLAVSVAIASFSHAESRTFDSTSTTRAQKMPIASPELRGETRRQVTVTFGDLNLLNAAGIETLYRRLELASEQVCLPRPSARELRQYQSWKGCTSDALDRAVADVGLKTISALHFAQSGRSVAPDNTPWLAIR